MHVFKAHTGPIRGLAISPDGTLLATGSDDRRIGLWEKATGKKVWLREEHTDWVRAVSFSPDGNRLVSAGWDDRVCIWGLNQKILQFELRQHFGGACSLAWNPSVPNLVTGSGDGEIRFLRLFPRRAPSWISYRLQSGAMILGLAVTPDGKTLYAAGHDQAVTEVQLSLGGSMRTIHHHGEWVRSIALCWPRQCLAVAGFEGKLLLVHPGDGTILHRLAGHEGALGQVAFTPDARSLLSVGWDGVARQWDLTTGQLRQAYDWGVERLLSVVVSADGMTAAAGSATGDIVIWDLE